jgi:hypothetical protein
MARPNGVCWSVCTDLVGFSGVAPWNHRRDRWRVIAIALQPGIGPAAVANREHGDLSRNGASRHLVRKSSADEMRVPNTDLVKLPAI